MSRRFLAVALVLGLLPLAGIALAGGGQSGLADARQATAAFHDLEAAKAAGYTVKVADLAGIECIAHAGEGAMGVHMLNPNLLFDEGVIDASQPELLVYEPRNDGTLKLVALEYLVLAEDWEGATKPALFGKEFDTTEAGNRYGLLKFYALHAWIWKPNPSGILYAWNPRVDCG